MVVVDLNGRIKLFSDAAEELLGFSAAEAHRELLVQDLFVDTNGVALLLDALDASGSVNGRRMRLRAQDGEPVSVKLCARLLKEDDEQIAWMMVFQDFRSQDMLEGRLNRATDRLIAAEKRTTTMEIAGAAAHHLNQPLTSIMGSIELLASRRDLPPDVRRRVHQIYDQLERMARAVRELAQVQKHQLTPYISDIDILDLSADD